MINVARIAGPIFELQTNAFGRITVDNLTITRLAKIEKAIKDRGGNSPIEFIDILIGTLAKDEKGKHLTPEQIASLSSEEKEHFAEQLLNYVEYMYHDLVIEQSENDKGETTVSCRKGDVTIPRNENESATAYLQRTFSKYLEKQAKIFEEISPKGLNDSLAKSVLGWASPSTLSALTRNAKISDQIAQTLALTRTNDALSRWNDIAKASDPLTRLSDILKPNDALSRWNDISRVTDGFAGLNNSIKAAEAASKAFKAEHLTPKIKDVFGGTKFEIPKPPPNPIHGTNERLDGLLERFERFETLAGQTVELVHSMNTAASGLLEAFANGARDTEKFSRRSIKIAWIALSAAIVMPIGQTGYDIWKSQQQDAETKRLVQGVVQQFLDTEQKSSNGFKNAISERLNQSQADEADIAKALLSLSSEIRALRESQPDRRKR
ncbi:hypothetical protein [Methylocystis sp. SC2]|uniref:hypothetical protein n=1 Tax=Methylocystis sp. (strain SC2) TaxID=187303 RepID=UPI00027AE933|nr:hypothetical protein [Methylocystis sp. SC2]CCJ06769.1 Hypothetical protein BN69_1318 [Methylocystis sp. SC2]